MTTIKTDVKPRPSAVDEASTAEPDRRSYVSVQIDSPQLNHCVNAFVDHVDHHELAEHVLTILRATAAAYSPEFARVLDARIGYTGP